MIRIQATNTGLPGGSDGKESAYNAEDAHDMGSIPGLGRSPGGGHRNPLQYSCLKNPMDRGAWRAIVHGVTMSDTTWKLNNNKEIYDGEGQDRQRGKDMQTDIQTYASHAQRCDQIRLIWFPVLFIQSDEYELDMGLSARDAGQTIAEHEQCTSSLLPTRQIWEAQKG